MRRGWPELLKTRTALIMLGVGGAGKSEVWDEMSPHYHRSSSSSAAVLVDGTLFTGEP